MAIVEASAIFCSVVRSTGCRWNGYRELIRLTRIARIDAALETPAFGRDAGPIEHRASLILQCNERCLTAAGSAVSVVVNSVCT